MDVDSPATQINLRVAPPMENALLLRGVSGWLSLANGVLAFKNIQAAYGDARWSDINGTYDLSAANAGKLTLQARGDEQAQGAVAVGVRSIAR